MAILQVIAGDNAGERHPLAGDEIDSRPPSRLRHRARFRRRQPPARQITCVNGEYFVEDLDSRNGTIVNGQVIQVAHHLQDGDRLKICDLSFAFYRDQPSDRFRNPTWPRSPRIAMLIDDGEHTGRSTIMSKLDITGGSSGIRVNVNPEIKLRAMIEITENLRKAISVDSVLPKMLDSLFKIFVQADRGFVVLRGATKGQLLIKAVKQRRADSEDMIRISRTIVNSVIDGKQAILSADAAADSRFEMSQSIADFRIRSMMCAPLVNSDGEALGVIQIDTIDQRARFQQDDLDVLASVASQAAFAVENAQLHEQAIKQQAIQKRSGAGPQGAAGPAAQRPAEDRGLSLLRFLRAGQPGRRRFLRLHPPARRAAGDRAGRRVGQGGFGGAGDGPHLVRGPLLPGERAVGGRGGQPDQRGFCRAGWDDRFVTFVLAVLDPVRDEADAGQRRPHAAAVASRHRQGRADRRRRLGRPAAGRSIPTRNTTRARSPSPAAIF